MSNILIVSGGEVNIKLLKDVVRADDLAYQGFDQIIAVDKGLEALDKIGIMPNHIIGDFDSCRGRPPG